MQRAGTAATPWRCQHGLAWTSQPLWKWITLEERKTKSKDRKGKAKGKEKGKSKTEGKGSWKSSEKGKSLWEKGPGKKGKGEKGCKTGKSGACHNCGKFGHYAKECWKRVNQGQASNPFSSLMCFTSLSGRLRK